MISKERLNCLSIENLQEVARRGNISFYEGMEKEKLIDLILDAMEEEQEDKNAQNNMAIKIETIKFNTYLMEELDFDYDADLTLPERYNETKMIFMPRDPSWGFLYWDIEEKVREELESNLGFEKIYIRIYQLENVDESVTEASDFFDIPIQFGDRRRYINLPENDSCYQAEIRVVIDEKEKVIVRSNSIRTSREFVMPSPEDFSNTELLINLSGFSSDFGTFPGREGVEGFLHRISPMSDEEGEAGNS
jgi:hypothetical protein